MLEEELLSSGEQLADRLRFETLISDTSHALFVAPLGQIDLAVERALESVRAFFKADRCGLLSASANQEVVNARLAAYAEGIPRVPVEINLAEAFPWTFNRVFVERKPLRVAKLADLPPEAEFERETWIRMSIRSALNLPIETGGIVRHSIVLNGVHEEREWPDQLVTRLRVLGEILISALERQERFAELRDAEERVNMAADSAEAGLWAVDLRTGVYWATQRAREIYGYSPDEVVTLERVEASVQADDRGLRRRCIERSLQERQPFELEYRILLADGRMRWVASRGRPHFTSAGEPDRLTGVSIDITESRRAQEALRVSEARLAAGADLAGLAFYELDYITGTSYCDDRFCNLCGLPPDQNEGHFPLQFWIEHLHPDDRPWVMNERERLHAGEVERLSVEYRFLHPAEGQKWIRHLARIAERDATGRAVRAYGVLRDITERRQAEEALRQSYAEIARLKDRLQAEGEYLKAEIRVATAHGEVIGKSAGIRQALHLAEQVAPTDSSVLLRGETGTGKELIAQAIHRLSPRRDHLMIRVNCAALPSGLVESELFGREKGAFTGALTRQIGRFEIADGSTIFLDEVGELPLDAQAKLLRVLEAGEFERLGSPRTIKVDVRVIAATNRDLTAAIRQGKFREDLYYRLNVFPIRVPPLRDRPEDIPLLVWAFLEEFSTRMGKKITRVQRKTMDALVQHPWPGNIRELRNVIEHGAIITSGDTLKIPMLDEATAVASPRQTLADAERDHILRALERTHWHIKGPNGAAAELGLNPATLYSRMKKLRIQPSRPREHGAV